MKRRWAFGIILALIGVGCAKDVKIYATKAPELQINQIKNLIIEPFVDQLGIQLKGPLVSGQLGSNQKIAHLLEAEVLKGLAAKGTYHIVPGRQVQGKPLDLQKTGILRAQVRYYELNQPGADTVLFVLFAKRQGQGPLESLAVTGLAMGIEKITKNNGKGFTVPVPYVETAGVLEVDFELIRASNHEPVIPTQTLRAYWHKKWGGNPSLTLLPSGLAEALEAKGGHQKGLFDQASDLAKRMELKQSDPGTFKALGYHLKTDPMVPLNPLAIRSLLAQEVATTLTNKVARHEVEFQLNLASGDKAASTLIKGGAFASAINRLESLPTPLDSGNLYNLGVAYEAMGEPRMAKRQYEKGLSQDKDSTLFQEGLKRL